MPHDIKECNLSIPHPFILSLIDLSAAAWQGDMVAAQQLRLSGEALDFAGGAELLCDVQGIAHDYLLETRKSGGRDLAGHMGAYWEHIPSWAAL